MNHPPRKRIAFRPSMIESRLEERLVLSGVVGVSDDAGADALAALSPMTVSTQAVATPPPAPPPVSAREFRARTHLTLARLRADYMRQAKVAARDLRTAVKADVSQLYANGATPTAQQMADFDASVAGAVDATALRLSTQAALLPNSSARLVPAIQDAILGSGPRSLVSRLNTLAQSGQLSGTTAASSRALTRLFTTTNQQTVSQLNNFFNTTPVNQLSVNASGQHIPLQQFLGSRLVSQVGNTLGSLAQSFPNVANAALFPNGTTGTTGTPAQSAMNAFTTQSNNALATAAFELGSGLSLFPGSSSVVSQIAPMLFGSGTTGNSLASALANLQFGSSGFNTAVSTAFGNAFQNVLSPLGSFFAMAGQPNLTLPTTGFTSPFGSAFTGSTFDNGFNNGFATGTTPGFIGFGTAPTAFNTNFGTGFNNFVTTVNQANGFAPMTSVTGTGTSTGTGLTNPGTGTGTGLLNPVTGTGTGTTTGTGLSGPTTGTGTTTGTGIV